MPPVFDDDEQPAPSSNAGVPALGFTDVGKVSVTPDYVREAAVAAGTEVKLLLEVTGSSTTVGRLGLDLVVVLDVSGSMGDDGKLDKLKSAMQFVIKKLTPMDRLSIATFNNSADKKCKLSSMSDAAKTTLGGIVNGLVAGGGTNIKAGLETGLATINGRKFKDGNRATIILLMSDGQQNDGDARQVSVPSSVPVYTLGFGRGTDDNLLDGLKKNGGTFGTVRDGGDMTAVFSQLVAGFLTVLVQDLQLTLTKPDDTDLDKILRVDPGDYTTEPANGPFDSEVTVKFGILFSGEVRKVIVYLSLKQAKDNGVERDILEIKVSYAPNSRLRGETLFVTRVATASSGAMTRKLETELARRQHAGSITAARKMADANNLDDARQKLVDAQNALEDILDQSNPMVDMLRTELEHLLDRMESQERYEAEGRAYALASESSHASQRFGSSPRRAWTPTSSRPRSSPRTPPSRCPLQRRIPRKRSRPTPWPPFSARSPSTSSPPSRRCRPSRRSSLSPPTIKPRHTTFLAGLLAHPHLSFCIPHVLLCLGSFASVLYSPRLFFQ